MSKGLKPVVLGVTGSIAAYKACEIVTLLKREGVDVHVLLTKEACEFITPLTLQTLSGNKVVSDMYAPPGEWNPAHTALADAAGVVLIAPAMNEKMYRHKIVRENIAKLDRIGYRFIGPIRGRLACGHEDIGHLAEVRDIVKETKRLLP